MSKPTLFEPDEPHFWDDPHISRSMLEAHIDQTHDGASRRSTEIENTVRHLVDSSLLKTGNSVLDLGCGPGLYSSRLFRKGIRLQALICLKGL